MKTRKTSIGSNGPFYKAHKIGTRVGSLRPNIVICTDSIYRLIIEWFHNYHVD